MTAILFCLTLLVGATIPAGAIAARSDWTEADRSQLRLLLAPSGEPGRLAGGIEIVLEPEWYTYWRNPGEAGVPPEFDFSASENVADVEVFYPAPERYDDGVSVSLVYHDEVVFPLAITPVDADQPVTLRVDAQFGVCRDICIPTRAGSAVALGPSPPPDALTAARLERYQPRVPEGPQPGRLDVENVTVADDSLLIDVRMPDSSQADLFTDPPPGWYLGQPKFLSRADGVSRYRLSLEGRPPEAAISGQRFHFVATTGSEAVEEIIELR